MIGLLALSACQPKPATKEKPLEIDNTMQAQVQTLLKDKMEETRAYAGQVLVMNAATRKMQVCAGWLRTQAHDHPTDAGLLQAGSHRWGDCPKGTFGKYASGHVLVHG